MTLTVLVTGGSGLVGKSLQKVVSNCKDNDKTFYFLSSKDCDLRDINKVTELFEKLQPDIVVHLASCVGGVYANMNKNYTFLVDNVKINLNIVESCKKFSVKRLINILSTCIFPDKDVKYPLTSDQLHNGLPHNSNIGYAYSKRVLHLASQLLVESELNKSNLQVVNLTPTNLYGEYDNYDLLNSHVIPGLIHKTYISKISNGETKLTIFGSGNAKRQFLYVDDLSKVILEFLTLHFDSKEISCIVSPPESHEVQIKDLISKICGIFNYNNQIYYDTSYSDGQYRKTSNNDELNIYLPNFKFTSIDDGLQNTINYFIENYDNVRK